MTWRGITAMRPGNGAGNGCFPRADAGGICAARRACSRAVCGDQQTSDLPHLPPFVCHTSSGAWRRHSYDSGTARPQRCENHHDLHPCTEPWTIWGTKPRRPALRNGGSFCGPRINPSSYWRHPRSLANNELSQG